MAHLFGDQLRRIGVDHVVDGVHVALLHQQLDDVDGAFGHAVGEFLNGDRFRHRDFARCLFGRHLEALRLLLQPLGAAAEGRDRAAALVVFGHGVGDGELAAAAIGFALGARRRRRLDIALGRLDRFGALVFFFVLGGQRLDPCRSGRSGFGRKLLGRFFGFALAVLFDLVTGVVIGLAPGSGFFFFQLAFVVLQAALGVFFLALAVCGLAQARVRQRPVARGLLVCGQGAQHHARARLMALGTARPLAMAGDPRLLMERLGAAAA